MELNALNQDLKLPFPEGESVKTIKSKFNNQYISVLPQQINDETYAIHANDQCLQVYQNNYMLGKCVNTSNYLHPQYFEIKKIMNNINAKNIMNSKQINDTGFPYTIFKHKNTNNCLSLDNEGIYMDKCDANNLSQKWEISPNENICIDK